MNQAVSNASVGMLFLIAVLLTACTQENPTHYFKNGSAKLSLKDYSGAITDLDLAIKLRVDYTDAYYLRAICFGELGDIEKSANDFNKVLTIDPNYMSAYVNRAFYVREPRKDFEGALADYNKFIEMNTGGNNAFAFNNRGFVKYNMGHYSEALDDINNSLKIDPTNSYAYKNKALIYISMDSMDVACADLKKAIELGYNEKFDDAAQRLVFEHCQE
jgi:tetratricopeptide (TPR) repeat protein